MTEENNWVMPAIPPEHKSIAPYFRRAQELKTKDPIMAYWCTLYGVEKGMTSKNPNNQFLSQVMNILEKMKASLSKYGAVTSNESGSEHVEKFAMRVFNQADNEVRNGTATRSTAKKFLASAHFLEVLGVFDPELRKETVEKIKYARWNAVNLAQEGNKAAPVEIDGDRSFMFSPTSQEGGGSGTVGQLPSGMSAWSPNTSVAPSPAAPDQRPLEACPISATSAPLSPPSASETGNGSLIQPCLEISLVPNEVTSSATDIIESIPPVSPPRTPPPRQHPGTLSFSTHKGQETPGMWSTVATPGTPGFDDIDETPSKKPSDEINKAPSERTSWVGEPTWEDKIEGVTDIEVKPTTQAIRPTTVGNRVIKRVHFTPSVKGGSSASSSVGDGSPPASPRGDSPSFYAPSLPTVEEGPYTTFEEDDAYEGPVIKALPDIPPMTPSGTESSLPSPPVSVPSPLLPLLPSTQSTYHASYITTPSYIPTPSYTTASPMPPPSPPKTLFSPPIPPPAPPPLDELSTIQISRIQKHCRFAISALDYEDVETARRELRAALNMLGEE